VLRIGALGLARALPNNTTCVVWRRITRSRNREWFLDVVEVELELLHRVVDDAP